MRARRPASARASSASVTAAARPSRPRPLEQNFEVCPQCGKHHKLGAAGWRELILDEGKLEEWGRASRARRPPRLHRWPRLSGAREDVAKGDAFEGGHRDRQGAISTAFPSPTARSSSTSWAARWARSWARKIARAVRARCVAEAPRRALPGLGRRTHAGGHPEPDADGGRPWRHVSASVMRACPSSACSSTRPPAASQPASRSSVT